MRSTHFSSSIIGCRDMFLLIVYEYFRRVTHMALANVNHRHLLISRQSYCFNFSRIDSRCISFVNESSHLVTLYNTPFLCFVQQLISCFSFSLDRRLSQPVRLTKRKSANWKNMWSDRLELGNFLNAHKFTFGVFSATTTPWNSRFRCVYLRFLSTLSAVNIFLCNIRFISFQRGEGCGISATFSRGTRTNFSFFLTNVA